MGVITLVTIVCVLVGCAIHFGGSFGGINVNIGNRENQGSVREDNIELDSFTRICVDAAVMGLTVEKGDDYKLSYNCTKNLIPEYEVKDGVLYINQKQKNTNWIGTNNCNAILTIPDGILLEMVEITSDVGDVNLDRLAIIDLTVYCDVGDVSVQESVIGDAKMELDVGDLDISDSEFESLDVYSDVGDIDIDSAADLSDYTFDIAAELGDIEVNGKDYKDECYIKGDQGLIKIGSDIGAIEISWDGE